MRDQTAEKALRERARKLQALHIRLLFCPITQERWLTDSDKVLHAFGLSPEVQDSIPDITTDQFKAESHGRQILVERGIEKTFPETQQCLQATPDAPTFDDFICSESFLDPKSGLPHTSGVGQGYENNSKYFFWLKQTMHLTTPDCDVDLRKNAYTEFATWLVNEYNRPHDPYYDQFEGGLYWVQTPEQNKPIILLGDQLVVYTLNDSKTIEQLPIIGLTNLDDVTPPDWPDEPTLL
ncbi:MAG: hypothetical protein GKS01_12445 [Alphaproteobacteria bacterium]|nr:hypothetical protein [Alphaproteobacteria bacterium]